MISFIIHDTVTISVICSQIPTTLSHKSQALHDQPWEAESQGSRDVTSTRDAESQTSHEVTSIREAVSQASDDVTTTGDAV